MNKDSVSCIEGYISKEIQIENSVFHKLYVSDVLMLTLSGSLYASNTLISEAYCTPNCLCHQNNMRGFKIYLFYTSVTSILCVLGKIIGFIFLNGKYRSIPNYSIEECSSKCWSDLQNLQLILWDFIEYSIFLTRGGWKQRDNFRINLSLAWNINEKYARVFHVSLEFL